MRVSGSFDRGRRIGMADFLEPRKKRKKEKTYLRVDPDALAEIVRGEAEVRRRKLSAAQAKSVEARKANRRARQKAVWSRRDGQRSTRLLAVPGQCVVAARMAPGRWYARRELIDLVPEFAEGSVRAWVAQKLLPAGILERAQNPAFDHSRGVGIQLEPMWFYRLTVEGKAQAEGWRGALGDSV